MQVIYENFSFFVCTISLFQSLITFYTCIISYAKYCKENTTLNNVDKGIYFWAVVPLPQQSVKHAHDHIVFSVSH